MDDIVIIGGGVVGSSAAYHLARDGRAGRISVVERDPTYEKSATARSAGGIRQQFSLRENILMSQYGLEVYGNFEELMSVDGDAPDLGLRQQGYLFLATEQGVESMKESHRLQRSLGVPVELLDRGGLKARFPSLVADDIEMASFGPEDGWIDPYAALQGFRRKARSLGAVYLADEVVAIETGARRAERVRLKSGKVLAAGTVINAAGAWSGDVAAMVGMPLPVEPVRRMTFFFDIREGLEPLPLVIDPSGLWLRPEGRGYICGRSNPEEPPGYNFEVDHAYFDEVLWPLLAARVPAFQALKVGRSWACLYDLNRLDENLIIGPWEGGLENFHVACGFSGHGLQQAPAVGRALAELVLDGRFVAIDLSRLTYRRVVESAPRPERAIV